ncbi:putative serine/threonine-protein kinase [Capsicum chinense]|nr:putative serine/threonine-protein kinase [Capsicum chinense]
MLVRKLYNNLEIGLHEKPSVKTCCASIVSTTRSLYNLYQVMEQNIGSIEPPTSRCRFNDLDDEIGEELGLQCCRSNDFDSYLSQDWKNIRDETGKQQLLSWWKTHIRQFAKLSRMVRDLLSAQASSVASEQAFSAGRFIIGDHRYSLARDSLKISVLFRDWINSERRNFGLPKLPPHIEDGIDEIFEENSDDGMEAMKEQGNRPIPEDLSAEELETVGLGGFCFGSSKKIDLGGDCESENGEEKREGVNHEKKSQNVNVESTETVEVKGAENVTVGDEAVEANEADVTKKDDKAEHEGKPRKEKRRSKPDPRLSNPPKHKHGEQVAAGWPSWLSAHVGEAIDGWLPRRADTFEKIDKIGQGTYSNVYKARDTITGKIVALKKVRFDNLEPESVRFMAREIIILRRLDHPNVIKLEGLVTSRMSCSLYLVFEYMEHDLAGLAASPEIKFTEAQVKCYMHQLLSGLEHCHNRHVLHRDIKGSNLLLDNSGILRIADFGLATIFDPHHKHQMTSRVVTLWYRPPELLLGATDYGAGIDLWSAGCILAELLAGKPIMPGRTEVEQLHKIYKLCGSPSEEYWKKSKLPNATLFKPRDPYRRCIRETFKDFPQSSLPLIDTLLAIDPAERKTATDALQSEFFNTEPYACDPSSLPKYPPTKEMDAKRRDDEARRSALLTVVCSVNQASG